MFLVESFEFDYNVVVVLYVRYCGVYKVGIDGVVNKFDICFCQLNKQVMKFDIIYMFEYLFVFMICFYVEKYDYFDIIDIFLMGC